MKSAPSATCQAVRERQRVLLARALAGQPSLLVLDEPMTGVDAQNAAAFRELLHRLNRETGITVLLVTHDIRAVAHDVTGVPVWRTARSTRSRPTRSSTSSRTITPTQEAAMEMFEYAFMQRAFIVGVLLALIIPLIGVTVVLRRLSMLGDALSHTSLAGVAAGLLLNVNPVFGASVFCVGAAFGIEGIRRRFPRYAELSISVMLSAGVGLAGVLSGFTKNAANFNSFLFGSIVAISDAELYSVAAVSLLVLLASVLLYKELFSIALDEARARLRRAG